MSIQLPTVGEVAICVQLNLSDIVLAFCRNIQTHPACHRQNICERLKYDGEPTLNGCTFFCAERRLMAVDSVTTDSLEASKLYAQSHCDTTRRCQNGKNSLSTADGLVLLTDLPPTLLQRGYLWGYIDEQEIQDRCRTVVISRCSIPVPTP